MTTRAEIERQLEEGYKEAHRLAIEEAEEFLKANGYYVVRLAEMPASLAFSGTRADAEALWHFLTEKATRKQ